MLMKYGFAMHMGAFAGELSVIAIRAFSLVFPGYHTAVSSLVRNCSFARGAELGTVPVHRSPTLQTVSVEHMQDVLSIRVHDCGVGHHQLAAGLIFVSARTNKRHHHLPSKQMPHIHTLISVTSVSLAPSSRAEMSADTSGAAPAAALAAAGRGAGAAG